MFRNLGKMFLALSLLVVAGAVTARAQIESDVTIEANIPFAFIVNDTTLPAGKYTIKSLDINEPTVLELRSVDGQTSVLFNTESAQAEQTPNKSELVFDKIGGKYFLSQVWLEGSDSGNEVM